MNFRQWLTYRFLCWVHGQTREDWYRRQLEANQFDRECAEEARGQ